MNLQQAMQSKTQLHYPQPTQWSFRLEMVVRIGKVRPGSDFGMAISMLGFANGSLTKEAGR